MCKFKLGDLTVSIDIDSKATINRIIGDFEKGMRSLLSYELNEPKDWGGKESAMDQKKQNTPEQDMRGSIEVVRPKPCFCGGAPLMHVMPYVIGEPTLYRIECGACHWGIDYHGQLLEFATEAEALSAWNAALTGETHNG